MNTLNESVVEDAALSWYRELGYAVAHGPALVPGEPAAERESFGDVILVGRLRDAIRRLNPAIPEEARSEAQRKVLLLDVATLVGNNRTLHQMLRNGVEVEYKRPDGILAQPLTFDGTRLSISAKYNAGGSGTFFLLGKKALPRHSKSFFVLVLEQKGKARRFWIVPSRVLAESQMTKIKPGVSRSSQARKSYLGMHAGSSGHEVYFNHLSAYEGAWSFLCEASMK